MSSPARHSLLVRQLKKVFSEGAPPPELSEFIRVVDDAYEQFDDDRLMLERSLDLSSEELFHANTEMRALFQALPDLVLRVRPDGRVVDVKPGYDRSLYLGADVLVGQRLQDPPIGTKEVSTEAVLEEVLARKELRTIQYELKVKGKQRWYEARLLPYLGEEVLIVVRDITDRVKALKALTRAKAELENRVAERTAELRETNQALRAEIQERKEIESRRRRLEAKLLQAQKLESLGVLAGGIAHDFNNLLMAILGNASLGLDALPLESPARRHLQEIEAASQRASGLTNQMLAYSGKGRFVVEHIDVSTVSRSMADLLEVSISKKAKLVYELSDQLPLVEADATQVGQVVMNLITNASEALGDEGGAITMKTMPIAADSEYLAECVLGEDVEEGSFVAVEVSDNGVGMSDGMVNKIFDPFFTTKFTGRGLGLAAVLGIVRGHGGAIRVASAEGKGTRFTVLLPAVDSPVSDEGPEHVAERPNRGMVLVVDDDPAVRRVLRATLENHGFRAVVAEDGRDGLSVFRRHVKDLVAVVLDMTMPVMDGRQAYEQMRAISTTMPVVIISGYARETARTKFEDDDSIDFLQKPFLPRDLVVRLEQILSPASSPAPGLSVADLHRVD